MVSVWAGFLSYDSVYIHNMEGDLARGASLFARAAFGAALGEVSRLVIACGGGMVSFLETESIPPGYTE